jgi:hypothetical protein
MRWQRKAFTIVGVMDLNSRKMLNWKILRPIKPKAVANFLDEVIDQYGNPPALVVGIDRVFSSAELKAVYQKHTCFPVDLRQGKTSVTIFMRSLWRNLNWEGLSWAEPATEEAFEQTINSWLHHYNGQRPHQALDYETPDQRWIQENNAIPKPEHQIVVVADEPVVQLKIMLLGVQPPIWRRVQVGTSVRFDQLHQLFQTVMGWTNSHLHEFRVNEQRIGQFFDGLDLEGDDELIDEKTVRLGEVITQADTSFQYTYDFGDSWEHEIVIEHWLTAATQMFYPVCLDGERNCPPEDCGGVWGYKELLTVLNDRTHPDQDETLTWLGGRYHPESFNLSQVNRQLAKRFG